MKKTISQKTIVKKHLEREGYITNLYAIHELYILRLGALICELRKEGMDIETEYIGTKGHKNCKYSLKRKDTLW